MNHRGPNPNPSAGLAADQAAALGRLPFRNAIMINVRGVDRDRPIRTSSRSPTGPVSEKPPVVRRRYLARRYGRHPIPRPPGRGIVSAL